MASARNVASSLMVSSGEPVSDDRDRLDLDEIVRVREGADLHHRGGRALGAEKLLAHPPEVQAVAHVGDVGGDLEQNGLRAGDPDALAVARRIVHAGRAALLDLRHALLLPPGMISHLLPYPSPSPRGDHLIPPAPAAPPPGPSFRERARSARHA